MDFPKSGFIYNVIKKLVDINIRTDISSVLKIFKADNWHRQMITHYSSVFWFDKDYYSADNLIFILNISSFIFPHFTIVLRVSS
jgi:hypothetical protein